jgi:hypothetical protein
VSDALLSREALWYGELPPVCVKTGRPADGTVDVSFERLPPWTYLLLLAGAGIVLVVVTDVRRAQGWITGVPAAGTPYVELRRVHPAFAAAMAEQREQARPTR